MQEFPYPAHILDPIQSHRVSAACVLRVTDTHVLRNEWAHNGGHTIANVQKHAVIFVTYFMSRFFHVLRYDLPTMITNTKQVYSVLNILFPFSVTTTASQHMLLDQGRGKPFSTNSPQAFITLPVLLDKGTPVSLPGKESLYCSTIACPSSKKTCYLKLRTLLCPEHLKCTSQIYSIGNLKCNYLLCVKKMSSLLLY